MPLFVTLNPGELQDLLNQIEKEAFLPRTVIFRMNEPGEKLYLIGEDEVHISYTNAQSEVKRP